MGFEPATPTLEGGSDTHQMHPATQNACSDAIRSEHGSGPLRSSCGTYAGRREVGGGGRRLTEVAAATPNASAA